MSFFELIQSYRLVAGRLRILSRFIFHFIYWVHLIFFVAALYYAGVLEDVATTIYEILFDLKKGILAPTSRSEDYLPGNIAYLGKFTTVWIISVLLPIVLLVAGAFFFSDKLTGKDKILVGFKIADALKLSEIAKRRKQEKEAREEFTKEDKQNIENYLPGVAFYDKHDKIEVLPFEASERVRHFLVIGAPGYGKTNFVNQNFSRLGKTIVHDFKHDYTEHFFNPDCDFIFNPFDNRCCGWTIFNEIERDEDIDALADSLIPTVDPKSKFWTDSAKDIFTAMLRICIAQNTKTNKDLWELISSPVAVQTELFKRYNETAALEHFMVQGPQTQGVKATFATATAIFKHLSKIDGDFSIKRWLRNGNERSTLFLANMANYEELMRPLVSLFFDFAAKEVLMMPDVVDKVRVNFVIDEFPVLQKMDAVRVLLTNGRSKGASVWVLAQEIESIFARYRDDASAIVNACSNRFYFRVNSAKAAKTVSEDIGTLKILKNNENQHFHEENQDVNINFNKFETEEAAVMDIEIKTLAKGSCYFKLANFESDDINFAKADLVESKPAKVNPGFLPRV